MIKLNEDEIRDLFFEESNDKFEIIEKEEWIFRYIHRSR